MNQKIVEDHRLDKDKNPAGGKTFGLGFDINWQNGPVSKKNSPNGAFVEGILEAVCGRIKFYQASKFACRENKMAIFHIQRALRWLEKRTRERLKRNVEGTHKI